MVLEDDILFSNKFSSKFLKNFKKISIICCFLAEKNKLFSINYVIKLDH